MINGLIRLEAQRKAKLLWVWNKETGTSYTIRVEDREKHRRAQKRRVSTARAKNHRNYEKRS